MSANYCIMIIILYVVAERTATQQQGKQHNGGPRVDLLPVHNGP